MKKKAHIVQKERIPLESFFLLWGSLFVLLGLATSLTAYYTHMMTLRYAAF